MNGHPWGAIFFQGQGKNRNFSYAIFCSTPEAGQNITEKSKINTMSPWEHFIW